MSARVNANAKCPTRGWVAAIMCLVLALPAHSQQKPIPPAPSVQVLFTPEEDAARAIIDAIQQAKHEVLVQAFSFTHKNIGRALQRAQQRGVRVEVLVDQQQFERGLAFVASDLATAHIPVLLDAKHGAAHNKVMMIDADTDQAIVVTGSFNFTLAAQTRNAENVVMFRGDRALAQRYRENWQRHRAHATRLDAK